jgi:hypothetical protein
LWDAAVEPAHARHPQRLARSLFIAISFFGAR